MDYERIYTQLISKAKQRQDLKGYSEKHHVIPRCMGGGDNFENLVVLTAREHFIAHWLLVKIYPKQWKVYFAFFQMTKKHTHRRMISSRQFESARKALCEGARLRYEMGAHPRKTLKGRFILSEKMKGDKNPMRKNPEKNHTARQHTVFFDDGNIKTYVYGKQGYIELGISRSSWIKAVKTGKPLPSFKITKIIKQTSKGMQ